jgi:S-adenosylmethionine decarboxylase
MATKRTIKQTHLGTHIIAELFGCKKINELNFVRESLEQAATICGATVLHTKLHKFSPQGITGYVLLAESHISIHTWPEHDYAAVDVFTCGLMDTEKAIHYLAERLGAQKVKSRKLERGGAFTK